MHGIIYDMQATDSRISVIAWSPKLTHQLNLRKIIGRGSNLPHQDPNPQPYGGKVSLLRLNNATWTFRVQEVNGMGFTVWKVYSMGMVYSDFLTKILIVGTKHC